MQGQALPGFRDFYPEDFAFRNSIFASWREVARRYGFLEYDGPPLEPLELYTDKSGAEIVQQLYAFEDKGGRKVALRPEMTPTLARMVGARAQALKKPIRWFSMPQLFRYERQQRGRLREHFQLNMDIIGEPGPAADAEIIAAAIDIARAFGLGPKDVRLRVSDRRIVTAQLANRYQVTDGEMPGVLAGLDKWDRNPADAEAILRKVLPATDQRIGAILEFMSGLREGADELRRSEQAEPVNECVARLDAVHVAEFGEDVGPVSQLAAELRTRGVAVEYALRQQPIRKQLELAAARGAPRALILGPDERKAKVAIVRDLKTGRQKKVPLTKVRKG